MRRVIASGRCRCISEERLTFRRVVSSIVHHVLCLNHGFSARGGIIRIGERRCPGDPLFLALQAHNLMMHPSYFIRAHDVR